MMVPGADSNIGREKVNMKVRIVNTAEEFAALEPHWNEILLGSEAANVQSTFEWLHTWWKHFGQKSQLFIIVAEDDGGEILGIAPLMIHSVGKFYRNLMKFRRLAFLGVGFTDYADFIIRSRRAEVLRAFFDIIYENRRMWDEVNLKQLNSLSPHIPILQNGYVDLTLRSKNKIRKFFEQKTELLYVDTTGEFSDYTKSLPEKLRKDLQKCMRDAEKTGSLELKVFDAMDNSILKDILRINRQRNRINGRRSMFLDRNRYAFINEVLPLLAKQGWLKIFLQQLDGKTIAYGIAFSFKNAIYYWNTSYDLDYSKCSPGKIIMYEMIRYCYENGYKKLDMMAGGEEYKFRWTSTLTNNYDFILRKNNIKTEFSLFYEKFKYRLKGSVILPAVIHMIEII